MRTIATIVLAAVTLSLVPVSAQAQPLTTYSQNFESLVQADPGALGADGWKIFANVFDPGGGYLYGYGVFPAPNNPGSPAFCFIADVAKGGSQGAQQLLVLSDYNNQLPSGHVVGNLIEANVFQEQIIGPGDVGSMWVFDYDGKKDNLAGNTTAIGFIKTLDPNNGYALSNFLALDMTNIPTSWSHYQLAIFIDPGLVGHILQFGFSNTATFNEPSGMLYDNVVWSLNGATSTETVTWGRVKSLYR